MSDAVGPAKKPVHPLVQLKHDIRDALPSFGLPDKRSQDRMASVLMVAVERDPDLVHADRQSLIASVRQCASHGLVPDGNEATLQIYNSKVKDAAGKEYFIKKVQYQPMVRGIINRVQNSGKVDAYWAEVVYEGEEFRIDMSQGDRRPIHNPDFFCRSGKIIGVYAVAKMTNGAVDCEPMTIAEVNKVKAVAKTKDIWNKWFEEKAKVAVLRRMSKRMPLKSEDMAMILNEQEHDFDAPLPVKPVTPNLSQRLTGEAEAAQGDIAEGEARDTSDAEDAEEIPDHEYDEGAVDPFAGEYNEGLKASKDGKTEKDCPHAPNTLEHNNWLGGWLFGMRAAADTKEEEDDNG